MLVLLTGSLDLLQNNRAGETIAEFGMLMITTAYSTAVYAKFFMRGIDSDYEVAPVASLVDTDEASFGQRGCDHIVASPRAGKIQDSRPSGATRSISILFE